MSPYVASFLMVMQTGVLNDFFPKLFAIKKKQKQLENFKSVLLRNVRVYSNIMLKRLCYSLHSKHNTGKGIIFSVFSSLDTKSKQRIHIFSR